jgi:hypothetical protein
VPSEKQRTEVYRCFNSARYFIENYVSIEDPSPEGGQWIPFRLWSDQAAALKTLCENDLTIILKARQLGLTWLVLAYFLWLMLFRPMATILIFSRRETEAIYLLDDRLKGIYDRLPDFLKVGQTIEDDSARQWRLSNGSVARAFPTSAGDSYVATAALVDEADLVVDLSRLLRAVKPTIDAGGKMVLLSRSNKSTPASTFKAIYRAAKSGANDWAHLFLPWMARPERDQEWYESQRRDVMSRSDGCIDDLYEQYPATDDEALAPGTKDKRISLNNLQDCLEQWRPVPDSVLAQSNAPDIPGLEIYTMPIPGQLYVIGADPAEGNPTSDDSALTVLDWSTQEEVAALAGKFEVSTFASYIDALGTFYNGASVMVERNNHGHAVLLWLGDNSRLELLAGHDGKIGWLSSTRGKVILYAIAAETFKHGATVIHSLESYLQLASIEGGTLRAPDGERDDLADSYALALCGCIATQMVTGWDTSITVSFGY